MCASRGGGTGTNRTIVTTFYFFFQLTKRWGGVLCDATAHNRKKHDSEQEGKKMERKEVLIERLKNHVKVCFHGHYPQIDDNENAESDGDELLRILTGDRAIGDVFFYYEDGKRARAVAAWVRQSPIIRPAYLAARTAKRQKAVPQWFVDRFASAFRPLRNNIFAYNLSNYHRDNRLNTLFSEQSCGRGLYMGCCLGE